MLKTTGLKKHFAVKRQYILRKRQLISEMRLIHVNDNAIRPSNCLKPKTDGETTTR